MGKKDNDDIYSLADELEDLCGGKNEEKDLFLLEDTLLNKNKKKKKKGKKSKKGMYVDGVPVEDLLVRKPSNEEEQEERRYLEDTMKSIEEFDRRQESDDDWDGDGIPYDGFSTGSSSDGSYKQEFSPEVNRLNAALTELKSFKRDLRSKWNEATDNSRVRGINKNITDLAAAYNTSIQTEISIIDKITSIKKTALDFNLKDKKAQNNEMDIEKASNSFMEHVFGMGRNNFVNDKLAMSDDNYDEDMSEQDFEDILNGELSGRADGPTEESNLYAEFEHLDPKIVVKRDISTGEWDYIAIGNDGMEIPQYPCPDKEAGMQFSSDGETATDKYGVPYEVLQVMSGM